ncbi:hypothetical protein BST81_07945 [Leptolyngbya sp. 'hensonii']|nr:hypothetical protein BST81_07945 [Leptolyngbya sp. 'hensonii']
MATRRLQETWADHGVRYVDAQGAGLAGLIRVLLDRGILSLWTDRVYEFRPGWGLQPESDLYPRYVAPAGMTAIAKALATRLDVRLGCRVVKLIPGETWHLVWEGMAAEVGLEARAVVIAVPAPQAHGLLLPLIGLISTEILERLGSIGFAPCLSVMAGYPQERQAVLEQQNPTWRAITFPEDAELGWLGWDSSKRLSPGQPVLVVQSSTALAERHLETEDLEGVGRVLLGCAGDRLQLNWLNQPAWMQVHRWRYAFATQPLQQPCFSAESSPPLICCGDWCPGGLLGAALSSGMAAAHQISHELECLAIPDLDLEQMLEKLIL